MEGLVKNLKDLDVLKSPNIIKAFLKVDRKDFVPANMRDFAYADEALPIGHGQTISQPYTVAFMLELLFGDPSTLLKASKIMDVGYGSGWTTALLAEIVGEEGRVFSFERVEELCNFGKENVSKYKKLKERVLFFCKDASEGIFSEKFDGIISAAELMEVPETWRRQLKIGGRLVYPKDCSIFKEIKKGENNFEVQTYPGFVFVPFIKNGNN